MLLNKVPSLTRHSRNHACNELLPQEASKVPSGEKATETKFSGTGIVRETAPSETRRNLIVLSPAPVATIVPSGDTAIDARPWSCTRADQITAGFVWPNAATADRHPIKNTAPFRTLDW